MVSGEPGHHGHDHGLHADVAARMTRLCLLYVHYMPMCSHGGPDDSPCSRGHMPICRYAYALTWRLDDDVAASWRARLASRIAYGAVVGRDYLVECLRVAASAGEVSSTITWRTSGNVDHVQIMGESSPPTWLLS